MMTRIASFLLVASFFCQQTVALSVFKANESSTLSATLSATSLSVSSTSLNYAVGDVETPKKMETFRDSIVKNYQREEPHISIGQLLTEQVAREFTTGRRYLLAAAAVKELSDHFYDVEEQQRVRAVELIEYARSHDIQIMDYASQVDKTPIDKSMETVELLQELLMQEQNDVQLLDQVMMQVSSKNTELFAFLETIRDDQMDRQAHIMQTLSDALPTLQSTAVDAATSMATAHVSTSDVSLKLGEDLLRKFENTAHKGASMAQNQLQGMGQHVHDLIFKSTFTGATAATVAAVDSVDTDSLPSTEEILDALPSTEDILDGFPVEDILQVVDNAATLLEEPSQLVDTIQQNLMETEALSQIVDIVTGLY